MSIYPGISVVFVYYSGFLLSMITISNNVTLVSCDLKFICIESPLMPQLYILNYLCARNLYLLRTGMRYIVRFIRALVCIYVNIPEYLSLFIYYFYKMPRLSIVIFSIIYYIFFKFYSHVFMI